MKTIIFILIVWAIFAYLAFFGPARARNDMGLCLVAILLPFGTLAIFLSLAIMGQAKQKAEQKTS